MSTTTAYPDIDESPFTNPFVHEEVRTYGIEEDHIPETLEDVSVQFIHPQGIVRDYLNKQFRLAEEKLNCPALVIGKDVWMSLTPMEIQSAWVPLQLAKGIVYTTGLGMGYFALRAASKPDVDKVIVVEQNPAVIRNFMAMHGKNPLVDKFEIYLGDGVEIAAKTKADVYFIDPYQTLLPSEVPEHIEYFRTHHPHFQGEAGRQHLDTAPIYRFWGQELVYASALYGTDIRLPDELKVDPEEAQITATSAYSIMTDADRAFLQHWMDDDEKNTMFDPCPDFEYIQQTVDMLTRITPFNPSVFR